MLQGVSCAQGGVKRVWTAPQPESDAKPALVSIQACSMHLHMRAPSSRGAAASHVPARRSAAPAVLSAGVSTGRRWQGTRSAGRAGMLYQAQADSKLMPIHDTAMHPCAGCRTWQLQSLHQLCRLSQLDLAAAAGTSLQPCHPGSPDIPCLSPSRLFTSPPWCADLQRHNRHA